MSALEALIIGILQGITEFLPISSSAHLKIAKTFFGIVDQENQVIFDLVCHLGTLSAALYFLRHEIFELLGKDRRRLRLFFAALIPLIPFYFLLKPLRELAAQTQFLGFTLMITAFILFSASRLRFKFESQSPLRDALMIGAMQSTALIPGISRSASTISMAHMLGWTARDAVRFSFLLSIPTILGGNSLELLRLVLSAQSPSIPISSCVIGFMGSLCMGLLVIRRAVAFLEKGNLRPFAWYCLVLGIAATFYFNFLG